MGRGGEGCFRLPWKIFDGVDLNSGLSGDEEICYSRVVKKNTMVKATAELLLQQDKTSYTHRRKKEGERWCKNKTKIHVTHINTGKFVSEALHVLVLMFVCVCVGRLRPTTTSECGRHRMRGHSEVRWLSRYKVLHAHTLNRRYGWRCPPRAPLAHGCSASPTPCRRASRPGPWCRASSYPLEEMGE